MLSYLHVKNLGIVADLAIEFGGGLNIVTGETGAGKSLLVDALSLIRGSRFAANLIGPFGELSAVTAVFQMPEQHRAQNLLDKWGLGAADSDPPNEGHIVVRRVCQAGGRTRNYVNDTPVHLRTIVELTTELVDISSQFAGQRLLDERSHLHYLDAFAGTLTLRQSYEDLFNSILSQLTELASLQRRRQELLQQKALLEAELENLDSFGPSEEDYLATKAALARRERLRRLSRELSGVVSALSDPARGCAGTLQQTARMLHQLSTGFPQEVPQDLSQLATEAQRSVDDLSFRLETLLTDWDEQGGRNASDGDECSLRPTSELEARLERYLELTSRFGVGVTELQTHASHIRSKLAELGGLDDRMSLLAPALLKEMTGLVERAEQLSAARQNSLNSLGRLIEHELAQLGMSRARFEVELIANEGVSSIFLSHENTIRSLVAAKDGSTLADRVVSLSRAGAERARFLIAPNPGSPAGPLRDVASGGELSRLMLSIKKVLFEDDTMSVFVFDEIDTGISGQVAAKVGQKLREFCLSRQAIVVTHLPQVACFAERHFIVTKASRKGTTVTQIVRADESARQNELAKMLSGASITAESLAQALRLMSEARTPPGRSRRSSKSVPAQTEPEAP